ncbi:MAG: MFS transporter [Bacilli bacterium]|jgi:predicted MFS family arabinose efflux permease|nr:MFS transporter [Bacilli bacterium]
MQKKSIFSRDFWLISLINFFEKCIYYCLIVSIGSYCLHQFNASTTIIGLVVGLTVIGVLIIRMLSSFLMHHFDSKKLLLIGTICLLPILVSYMFVPNLLILIFIRFIHGLASGLISSITNTSVVLLFDKKNQGEGIGYFSLSTIVAAAIGPFLGLFIVNTFNFQVLFILLIILGIIVILCSLPINKERIKVKVQLDENISIDHFIEKKSVPVSCIGMIVCLGYAFLQSYLSFYAKEVNVLTYASYFFLVYSIFVFISRPITGKVVDRYKENYVIYPSIILFALGLLILYFTNNGIVLLISAAVIGLGFGNFQSTLQIIAAKIVIKERLSHSMSTYFILFDIGMGFGPLLLGIFIPVIGYHVMILALIVVAFIGLILYYLVHGRLVNKIY